MLAGGGFAFGGPFQDEDPSRLRFNAGAEETRRNLPSRLRWAGPREVDWLLQKPEFCVICFVRNLEQKMIEKAKQHEN